MKTLLEVLQLSADYLQKKGIKESRRQAEEMLCDVFGFNRVQLYIEFERPLNPTEIDQCRHRLMRRANGEPLQYIHGEVDLYNCKFLVNKSVLIPRQETELLVDKIVQRLSKLDLKKKSLWDMCCGSGCIGIALKKKFPELEITLSDFSQEALILARENAERNGVQVKILQGDLLQPFKDQKTDFFVCNPPYVSEKEYVDLDREVRDFEPRIALVGGEKGTEFYERLARELPMYLFPSAQVMFEIGSNQGEALQRVFAALPWRNQTVEKDWAGHSRFFFLEIE